MLAAALTVTATACTTGRHTRSGAPPAGAVHVSQAGEGAAGPLAWLLAASTDLGPSRRPVGLVVSLQRHARPVRLLRWARAHELTAGWQRGDGWASVSGRAPRVAAAFGVPVHDYRSRSGVRFYASGDVIAVPAPVRTDVRQVGRILSYVPVHTADPHGLFHTDVPSLGLTPAELRTVYDIDPLTKAGYTGKGKTIVFFEIDSYTQSDLDAYAKSAGLPAIRPELITHQAGTPGDETPLDLEVAHAVAPDATLAILDATVHANTAQAFGEAYAQEFRTAEQRYPGAIFSISLGLSCEALLTAADLEPAQEALQQAEANGTSAFISTGDTGSLECKSTRDFATPPNQSDIGVNGRGTLPAITSVGGTALSTDATGHWIAEQAWTSSVLSQGSSGGPSGLFGRPSWQQADGISTQRGSTHRLTPDVSADADPATGVRIYAGGAASQGGGTSQAAPIWAAITVLMNQYLADHGGHALGDLNPLLYRVAASTPKAFHDITVGGSAVDAAGPGYDLVTGLGSPDVAVLAGALLAAQKGSTP